MNEWLCANWVSKLEWTIQQKNPLSFRLQSGRHLIFVIVVKITVVFHRNTTVVLFCRTNSTYCWCKKGGFVVYLLWWYDPTLSNSLFTTFHKPRFSLFTYSSTTLLYPTTTTSYYQWLLLLPPYLTLPQPLTIDDYLSYHSTLPYHNLLLSTTASPTTLPYPLLIINNNRLCPILVLIIQKSVLR